MGDQVRAPQINAAVQLTDMQVFVDLAGLIDVDAEVERLQKQVERLTGTITGKEKKLSNQKFVDRAPADVVQRERDALVQLKEQLETVSAGLAALGGGRSVERTGWRFADSGVEVQVGERVSMWL